MRKRSLQTNYKQSTKSSVNNFDVLDIVLFDDIPDSREHTLLKDVTKTEHFKNREYTRKSIERDLAEEFLLVDDTDSNLLHVLKTTAADIFLEVENKNAALERELDAFLDQLIFEDPQGAPIRAYGIDNIFSIGVEGKEPQAYIIDLFFQKHRQTNPRKINQIKEWLLKKLQQWAKTQNLPDVEFNTVIV